MSLNSAAGSRERIRVAKKVSVAEGSESESPLTTEDDPQVLSVHKITVTPFGHPRKKFINRDVDIGMQSGVPMQMEHKCASSVIVFRR